MTFVNKALQSYHDGAYQEAAQAFEAAYSIARHQDLLYAWAQAERLGGDCLTAIPLYRAFLLSTPPQKEATFALVNLRRCQKTSHSLVGSPPTIPWHKDWVAHSSLLVGLGGLVTSAALQLSAQSDARAAEDADSFQQVQSLDDRVRHKIDYARVGLLLGGSLVAGALLRYLLRPPAPLTPSAGI